jgi:hypothetical protein
MDLSVSEDLETRSAIRARCSVRPLNGKDGSKVLRRSLVLLTKTAGITDELPKDSAVVMISGE